MTTYSISLRHIKIHPMVQTELIPHRTRQGWNLVLQVRESSSAITISGVEPGKELTFSEKVIEPEFDGKAAMQASKESQKKAKKKGILLILGRNQPVNRCFWRFTGAKEK